MDSAFVEKSAYGGFSVYGVPYSDCTPLRLRLHYDSCMTLLLVLGLAQDHSIFVYNAEETLGLDVCTNNHIVY